jgi:hypothetical protein
MMRGCDMRHARFELYYQAEWRKKAFAIASIPGGERPHPGGNGALQQATGVA